MTATKRAMVTRDITGTTDFSDLDIGDVFRCEGFPMVYRKVKYINYANAVYVETGALTTIPQDTLVTVVEAVDREQPTGERRTR